MLPSPDWSFHEIELFELILEPFEVNEVFSIVAEEDEFDILSDDEFWKSRYERTNRRREWVSESCVAGQRE